MLSLPSWHSMNITVNFFSTKYMNHSTGCTILPEHMKVKLGSMDELSCYAERVDGVSENEEDSLHEAEFENNNSNNSDSVPDVCDDSISHDSPNSQDQGYKVSASFGWNQEYEAREPPSHSFTSEDQKPYSFNNKTTLMMSRQLVMNYNKRNLKRGNNLSKARVFQLHSQHNEEY
ncbi:unnamed protein product [Lupinus luteus]|uniref:Uncharacterized protein n=1 Tax=Lupinus luteus TaxID=3873 RepID=A0AAV1X785_LUPLU